MASKDHIATMRELLVARRDALRKALAGDLSLLSKQPIRDTVDDVLKAAQDGIGSDLAEVESRELANIEQALLRMKNGTYGQCQQCGQKIVAARLNALPYATLCLECRRDVERSDEANGAIDVSDD